MANDREFLRWVYDRMVQVHHESRNVDYMLRFDGLIKALPREQPNSRMPFHNHQLQFIFETEKP